MMQQLYKTLSEYARPQEHDVMPDPVDMPFSYHFLT